MRITNRYSNGKPFINLRITNEMENALEKLAKYEDMEEQGKLFKLPCSFEDTIYHITTCKDFGKVLDGTLWDDNGEFGTATGYYCPYELNSSCPFEDCDSCEECENRLAIFEDNVEQIMMDGFEEPSVLFKYSGWAYFSQFGKNVFTSREKAEDKLKELQIREVPNNGR